MIRIQKLVASFLGIGYLKGGGTITAVMCCLLWWWVQANGAFSIVMIPVTMLLTITGIWCATKVAPDWGKDSSRVVIDEAAGMCVSLLFVPVTLSCIVAGLLLFRFFDIVKPLFIRKTEALPDGWGVMADDILAGIYTNIILQVLVYFNVL